jgi:hypothetical protein
MPKLGFEHTIPELEQVKKIQASDRGAAMVGGNLIYP